MPATKKKPTVPKAKKTTVLKAEVTPASAGEPDELSIVVTTRQVFKKKDIACLLVSAFEGGINYWCERQPFSFVKPTAGWVPVLDAGDEKPEEWPMYDYPLLPGGAIVFKADDGSGKTKRYRMDLPMIEKGLKLMAEKEPRHFADFVKDCGDASTGDAFVQLCLFGEVVYA